MARTLVRRDRRRAPADRRSGRNAPLPGAPQPDIAFGTLGPLSPEEKFELHKHLVEPGGVSPGAEQFELSRLAIEARLGATDEPVAGQERQDGVGGLALRRRGGPRARDRAAAPGVRAHAARSGESLRSARGNRASSPPWPLCWRGGVAASARGSAAATRSAR